METRGRKPASDHKYIGKLSNGKWRVKARVNKQMFHVGCFDTLAEAIKEQNEYLKLKQNVSRI